MEVGAQTDRELVVASQKGDRAAFGELVRRFGRVVFARVYGEVREGGRAEDLTQETFLTAWKRIGQVKEAGEFGAWLGAIAHSVVVDAVRREGRLKRGSGKTKGMTDEREVVGRIGVGGEVKGGGEGPERVAEMREERERVLGVLEGMPGEYREVLLMRYVGGMEYGEMETRLGVSNGALRGLLSRGMVMLRERMGVEKEKMGKGNARLL